jgi:hypothetical protein
MTRYSVPSRILRVNDAIADFDIHRELGAVVERAAGTDRQDSPLLGLFFGGVGQENATGALLSLLDVLDDQTIAQRTKIHEKDLHGTWKRSWHSWQSSASDLQISRVSKRVQEASRQAGGIGAGRSSPAGAELCG